MGNHVEQPRAKPPSATRTNWPAPGRAALGVRAGAAAGEEATVVVLVV